MYFYVFRINTLKCNYWVKKIHRSLFLKLHILNLKWMSSIVLSGFIRDTFVCTENAMLSEVWKPDGLFWTEHFLFLTECLASWSCLSASLTGSACYVWLHPFWNFKWSQPVRQSNKGPSINITRYSVHGLVRSSECKSVFLIDAASPEAVGHDARWGFSHRVHFLSLKYAYVNRIFRVFYFLQAMLGTG